MWITVSLCSHFISAYLWFQSIFDENKLRLLIQTNWKFSWSCLSFFGQLMRDACHEVKVFLWPYCYLLPVKPTWRKAFLGFYFIICLTSVLWDRKLLLRWWEKRQPESDCCVRGLLPVQITKLLNSNVYLFDSLSSTQVKQTQLPLTNPFFLLMMTWLTGISSSDHVTEKRVGVTWPISRCKSFHLLFSLSYFW